MVTVTRGSSGGFVGAGGTGDALELLLVGEIKPERRQRDIALLDRPEVGALGRSLERRRP